MEVKGKIHKFRNKWIKVKNRSKSPLTNGLLLQKTFNVCFSFKRVHLENGNVFISEKNS